MIAWIGGLKSEGRNRANLLDRIILCLDHISMTRKTVESR